MEDYQEVGGLRVPTLTLNKIREGIRAEQKAEMLAKQRAKNERGRKQLGGPRGKGLSSSAPSIFKAADVLLSNYNADEKDAALRAEQEAASDKAAELRAMQAMYKLARTPDKVISVGDGTVYDPNKKEFYTAPGYKDTKQSPAEKLEDQKELKRFEAGLKEEAADKKRQFDKENDQLEMAKTYNAYRTSMDALKSTLDDVYTGPVWGMLPAATEDSQKFEGARANMAPVLKSLFRTSGEGTFTDKDQELLLNMIPTRKDSPEAARFKIHSLNNLVEAKLGISSGPQGNSGVTRGVVDRSDEFEARAAKYGM